MLNNKTFEMIRVREDNGRKLTVFSDVVSRMNDDAYSISGEAPFTSISPEAVYDDRDSDTVLLFLQSLRVSDRPIGVGKGVVYNLIAALNQREIAWQQLDPLLPELYTKQPAVFYVLGPYLLANADTNYKEIANRFICLHSVPAAWSS